MSNLEAYLKHGTGTDGPYLTESVEVKVTDVPQFYSATGYGHKIPTQYMVKDLGRWKRVYCMVYSNNGTTYIFRNGERIICDIYN